MVNLQTPPNEPAIVLIEFNSIGRGIQAGDAMAKKATLSSYVAGTVQPGKFLILVSGEVAAVEESLQAGLEAGGASVISHVLLPYIHHDVWAAVHGKRVMGAGESLGVIETSTVADLIRAADAAVKGAHVTLREIRLADGLGGHAFCLLQGAVPDVEAAVELGTRAISAEAIISQAVIAQLDPDLNANLEAGTHFHERIS